MITTALQRRTQSHTLEERYFERMAHSMGDKAKLLKFLPPVVVVGQLAPRILDVGAGGGEFSLALHNLGYDVVALDASEDAINHIKAVSPEIETIFSLANHGSEFLQAESFDAIICSSILHEVFSYGDDVHSIGHMSNLVRAISDLRVLLKPEGLLIVRDGVLPDNWEDTATITMLDDKGVDAVFKYMEMSPFANGLAYAHIGNTVELSYDGNKSFTGNIQSILEVAYTYTWGEESYPRETQELYAVKTLTGYSNFFTENGFIVTHAESYLQPGYPEHLQDKVILTVGDEKGNWFDSNAIWVCKKL
jgi:SAM-dependent methyltransferase